MEDENDRPVGDEILAALIKQDLDRLSVGDLSDRIALLQTEIERCKAERDNRGDIRSAAEKLFKI